MLWLPISGVAIENEDAGQDDEPDQNWYYFQANGKALTNGSNDHVALKTINGKKYAFDDEGKMLWGWVNADSAEHMMTTPTVMLSRKAITTSVLQTTAL